MGIQIHAGDNYRRVVEAIQADAIGAVREVHVFLNGKAWSAAGRPKATAAVPDRLNWDLWLGPATKRAYDPDYHPAGWRRYWDFGGGTLGDMACHYLDLPFWALKLKAPLSVRAEGPSANAYAAPSGLAIHYEFPSQDQTRPLKLSWWDGDLRPLAALKARGLESWHNGVLFVGDKGWLVSGYGSHQLGPKKNFEHYEAPKPSLKPSLGHHAEWIEACKTRKSTTCSFDYSGPLTETVLLGVVAHRSGKFFRWDASKLLALRSPAAQALIDKDYRKGWELF